VNQNIERKETLISLHLKEYYTPRHPDMPSISSILSTTAVHHVACVGRLLQEQIEEGRALKLTRKQLRKGFSSLGTQLTDSNEGLIFEALGEDRQRVFVRVEVVECRS
jgi:hypothetical protein